MGKRAIQEIVCSGITIAVAIVAFVLTFDMPERVFIFPRIASVTLFVFAVALLGVNIIMIKQARETAAVRMMRSSFVVYVIISLYVALIPVIGFFVCSIVMMLIFMLYMNIRSIISFLICIPVMVAFLYFVFLLQLEVPLPQGLLF
jgi:D-alanyl-lipoteichoic acid acyltransferase DltB (MBOAT superfamily)